MLKILKKKEKEEKLSPKTEVAREKEPVAKKDKKILKSEHKRKRSKPTPWWKDIVLGIVNLGFVLALIFLLSSLPTKATELKKARSTKQDIVAKTSIEIAGFEIESSRQKADNLKKLFPDEEGLLDFVREIDLFKEAGLITSFSFASEEVVRDRTGYFGIPFVVEFGGDWNQIAESLSKFEDIPFLFRAVGIESQITEENLIKFKYGGFLYVDESLAKD